MLQVGLPIDVLRQVQMTSSKNTKQIYTQMKYNLGLSPPLQIQNQGTQRNTSKLSRVWDIRRRGFHSYRSLLLKSDGFFQTNGTMSRGPSEIKTGVNIVDTLNKINDDAKFIKDLHYDEDDAPKVFEMESNNASAESGSNKPSDTSSDSVRNEISKVNNKISIEAFLDTFEIYEQLNNSGFTPSQSNIIIEILKINLINKLNWLDKKYSPRNDIENEFYLFEAATNEVKMDISNFREVSLVELTNSTIKLKRIFQTLQDESISEIQLNDNLIKLEVNQFKHENNLQNKQLNLKNQILNNKIITNLKSTLSSEIESLRWTLTSFGVLGIVIMAISILIAWNFTKNLSFQTANSSASGAGSNGEENSKPYLPQIHEPSDYEGNEDEYEADWDEKVLPLNSYLKK